MVFIPKAVCQKGGLAIAYIHYLANYMFSLCSLLNLPSWVLVKLMWLHQCLQLLCYVLTFNKNSI